MIVNGETLSIQDIDSYMKRFKSPNSLIVKYKIRNGIRHHIICTSDIVLMDNSLFDKYKYKEISYKNIVSICIHESELA